MSSFRGKLLAAGLLVVVAVSTSGCLSKKLFRRTVQEQDEKISDVQTGVEANERRLGDLKEETRKEVARLDAKAEEARRNADAALSRAENAEWLAKGKVLWEVTLTSDQVKFGFNESDLPVSAVGALDELAVEVKEMGRTVYLEIEGHTDSIGSPGYNHDLGLRRAEAVRRYLNQTAGLPLHLMSVISYGESRPVADNGTRDGRARNRRVVIRVLE